MISPMRQCFLVVVTLTIIEQANCYGSFTGTQLNTPRNSASLTMEYIPSGMSKAQWEKQKQKEAAKKGKNLGKTGITSFKSRSFKEWQDAGGINLFPVDPKKAKSQKDIPYMQRAGGTADDADLEKETFFSKLFKKKKVEVVEEEAPKKNYWTGR